MSGFRFLGVVHLLPLPAGPRPSPGWAVVVERALADVAALDAGGADGVILENFGDAPFPAGAVDPHVVALISRVGTEVRRGFPRLELGLNLLRNDARSAMGAAAAIDAHFIRVNIHAGAMLTDQGLLQGDAHGTLKYREALGARVRIAADVVVKHAVPVAPRPIGDVAADTFRRGGADVLIVTGPGTGRPTEVADLDAVRRAVPEAPLWIGSGVTLETAELQGRHADGAIVGTALRGGGRIGEPIEVDQVRRFRDQFSRVPARA